MVSLSVVGTGGASPSGSRAGRKPACQAPNAVACADSNVSDLCSPVRAASLLTERVVYKPNFSPVIRNPAHRRHLNPQSKTCLPTYVRPRRPRELTGIRDTSDWKGEPGVAEETVQGGVGKVGLWGSDGTPQWVIRA